MILARLICALTACMCLTVTAQAMSRQPSPIYVSYETGAYAASPVIYNLTINGRVLFSPSVVLSGAAKVPPGSGRSVSTSVPRLPRPNNTILEISVEWLEIWSGRQYAAQTRLDEANFPWFDSGLRLKMIFEQNGGFMIRVISKERWEAAKAMTSPGLPIPADYPTVFETCAPHSDGPPLSGAEVEQLLSEIWAVDTERLQENRSRSLPAPRCAGPQD